jgi:iron complex transport system ATP-binding protein
MSIEIENLRFSFDEHVVLKGYSLNAEKGEIVYVLGPNGFGKSTLFRCIMGQLKPTSGSILVEGKPISGYTAQKLAKTVAYIPQSCTPTFNYSVRQIAAMGRTAHLSLFASPSARDYQITDNALEKFGIGNIADCGICEISGGEQQLDLIVRALVQEAKILIMDEPTSSLDYGNQIRVQLLMHSLAHEGMLVLMSSHNPQYAIHFAGKVSAIFDGRCIAFSKPLEIITPSLIKALYGISVRVNEGMLIPVLT